MSLAFILGREPHLSVAELFAVLGDAVRWEEAGLSQEAMVARSLPIHLGGGDKEGVVREQQPFPERAASTMPPPLAPPPSGMGRNGTTPRPYADALISRLAGTIKIAEVLDVVPHASLSSSSFLTDTIGHLILAHTDASKRVRFGYSVYDLGGGAKEVQRVRAALTRGAKAQKAWLEAQGRKVRHVTSRDATLSSVTVERQGLLPEDNGVEVCVLVSANHTTLARTLAVQPYQEWSARDYGRPRRDARSGMLPPKLARIMVNIARVAPGGDLLDPFCGSGTVLIEAAVSGITRVVGTDSSDVAIASSRANIEWERARALDALQAFGIPRALDAAAVVGPRFYALKQCDVRSLASCLPRGALGAIHAIVTEPYLGAPEARTTGQRNRETTHLRTLYRAAFAEFAKLLQPGGRVVFVVPEFRSLIIDHRPPMVLDITPDVAPLGFTRVNPFPSALRDHPVLRGRDDLPYARADQRVGRRVLLFMYQPQRMRRS